MIKKIQKLKPNKLKQINTKHEYKSFYKTSLIGLVIIFAFFVLPDTINFIKKNFVSNKIIVNTSKQTFNEKLNQKNKKIKIDKDLISKNVFDDIDVFGKEESIFNPPRLSASTIEEVFNLNKYDLKKVKKTKLINIGNKTTNSLVRCCRNTWWVLLHNSVKA